MDHRSSWPPRRWARSHARERAAVERPGSGAMSPRAHSSYAREEAVPQGALSTRHQSSAGELGNFPARRGAGGGKLSLSRVRVWLSYSIEIISLLSFL